MLKTLELKNFKCYDQCKIEFDQITTFIGDNKQGKSSSNIHPLSILLLNGNFSENFIRYGTEEAQLTVTFDDVKVKRTRNSVGTTLSFIDSSGKEVVYNAKKGIDSEVQKYTGVCKVEIDEAKKAEDINFVPRKSAPFLLGRSSELTRRRLSGILMLNPLETAKVSLSTKLSESDFTINLKVLELDKLQKEIDILEKSIEILKELSSIQETLKLLRRYSKLELVEVPSLDNVLDSIELIEYHLKQPLDLPTIDIDLDPVFLYYNYLTCEESLSQIDLSIYNLDQEIDEYQKEVDKIPLCPTCNKPI